jgi:hypothetical protein
MPNISDIARKNDDKTTDRSVPILENDTKMSIARRIFSLRLNPLLLERQQQVIFQDLAGKTGKFI